MDKRERDQAARDVAGILARGFDVHVEAHGPDGSHAIRTENGERYEVAETMIGGAVSFVEYRGERFAVNVTPLAEQDVKGPIRGYVPRSQ